MAGMVVAGGTLTQTTLTFCGGTGSVTGANFLLDTGVEKILVDCGLIQGASFCDERNWVPFVYDPHEIGTLFVTHAHTDHIGRIPRLVRLGFSGVIYSTRATKDIAELMFEDALKVMREEEVRHGNMHGLLYEMSDVKKALSLWRTVPYHDSIKLEGGMHARLLDAGHILGSAMVEFSRGGKKLLMTGDLGNENAPLARPTEPITNIDYMVMESVYGDRNHENTTQRKDILKDAIQETTRQSGVLLIPAFSIERTQIILAEISHLLREKSIAPISVYLDSPLAIRLMRVYRAHARDLNYLTSL